MDRIFIIAEAGVNHNGSIETAKKMVDTAKEAGADAVKFQAFKAESLVTASAPKAEYQKRTTGSAESQFEMLKKLELDYDAHRQLLKYCREKDIIFISTPFDKDSADMLYRLGVAIFKIPSGEIINIPYLRKIGGFKRKVILSTGMSGIKEIKFALKTLTASGTPKKKITVLHCNTQYPTPMRDVNLRAMLTIRDTLRVKAGYSDHTSGIEVSIAAAALGASIIEKHFTLDKKMKGPDHKASVDPAELKDMISAIRNIEEALGSPVKKPTCSELPNRPVVRKSIVAAIDIRKGETFTEENITTKRPAHGLSPAAWDRAIGSIAKRDFRKDETIKI